MPDRFTVNGDGTVTDSQTNLMWAPASTDQEMAWGDGEAYASSLSIGDYTDWRMPTITELRGIIDYDQCNPSCDPILGMLAWIYWSSSTHVDDSQTAWYVYFSGGIVFTTSKTNCHYVRAVRG